MKIKTMIFIILIALISSCGSNPAEISDENPETGSIYNPAVHTLEKVLLDDAKTLVLTPTNIDDPLFSKMISQSVSEHCDELGRLDGAIYSKIETTGPDGVNITPCFKNVHFYEGNKIYGQYRPADSSEDVFFMTDATGGVHHFKKAPKKGAGFKNEKLIRKYKGKPTFLDSGGYITAFNLEDDTEEKLIYEPAGRFEILHRPDGDHLVYTSLVGGKRKNPAGEVDLVPEINLTRFFYENSSNDLGYTDGSYFKRMVFDATGNAIERNFTAVPLEFDDWLNGIGMPAMPQGPVFMGSMESCERSDNLLLCENKGFVVADSSADIVEVNWNVFEIYGTNPLSCLNQDYIYFSAGNKLTKILRDFSSFEHILINLEIWELACAEDGGVLISGYNTDSNREENFHLKNNMRTMLSVPVNQFIR